MAGAECCVGEVCHLREDILDPWESEWPGRQTDLAAKVGPYLMGWGTFVQL